MTIAPPTPAFLIAHPAHFIALGFGAGLARKMPGTFGTLVAFPIAWILRTIGGDLVWLVAIGVLAIAGIWASEVTGRNLGASDHGSIVIDEIVAFLVVLFFTGTGAVQQTIAFLLFRAFDIAKPPPIRQVDATFKNGAGVMADDFIAAFYALVVLSIGKRLFA